MADEWKIAGGNGDNNPVWDYKDPAAPKEIIGALKLVKTNVGANNSNLYEIEQSDGSMISIWGTALLDARFKEIPIDSMVKITYLGTSVSEKTKRTYHNFEVRYQTPAAFFN